MGNVNQTSTRNAAARPTTPATTAPAEAPDDVRAAGSSTVENEGHPSRGLLGGIADVFIGGGQAIGDMVKGLVNVVAHPIQTIKGIGYVITHPASLVHAFVEPYKQAIAQGRPGLAIGRGIVEIGSLFISPTDVVGAAKGLFGGAKGASEAGAVAAKAGSLGAKGAELSTKLTGQATAALEKAAAMQAVGAAGEAAKLQQFARIMQKSAALAAQGTDASVTRALRYATMAANAEHVAVATTAGTKIMSMAGLVDHSNALLEAAAKGATRATGEAAMATAVKGGAKAAKAVEALAPAYNLPVKLTKGATQVVKDLGLSSKQANVVLTAADDVFKQAVKSGATQKVALQAAKEYMGAQLGLAGTDRALDLLANTLKPATKNLLNNPATVAVQFERSNYVTRPMVNAAKTVGRPIDKGLVAAREAGQAIASEIGETTGKIASAAQRIGDLQIREIPKLVGEVATYPFRVAANGVGKAGRVIAQGLHDIGDLPLRRIWEVPIEAAHAAIAAGAEFVGRLPNMTVGELVRAPFQSGLMRPALAASLVGRVNSTQDMPSNDADIAKKYGIEASAENLKAFKAEIASYQDGAIGPDAGTPEQVKKLQTILAKLGYDVQPTGEFDDATAVAVIDFKQSHGITQSYYLKDGSPAINEYVDADTAKAMVDELKGQSVDPASLPKVSAEDVQAKLDKLAAAFDNLRQAKLIKDGGQARAKAKAELEKTTVDTLGALIAYGMANPNAKADIQAQVKEIGTALSEQGFSDDAIQALIDQAQANFKAKTKPAPEAASADAAPKGEVSGQAVSQSLDELASALEALRGATSDAAKEKATKAVMAKAQGAIEKLTQYGLAHPDAKNDVTDQLNEIAAALSEEGIDQGTIKKLFATAQASVQATKPAASAATAGAATSDSTEIQPGTLESYEAHMADLQAAMKAVADAKDTKTKQAAQIAVVDSFKGAVDDFNQLIAKIPADQAAKVRNQLKQVATALSQLGFSSNEIANIVKASKVAPAPAAGKPAAPADGGGNATPGGGSYAVRQGDSLSRIAQATLGDASRWREIYDANKAAIGANPNMILPGTKLVIPGAKPAAEPAKPVTPAATEPAPAATPEPAAKPVEIPKLTDAQIKALVADKGLLDDRANVEAFLNEVTHYQVNGALGPDSGAPSVVRNLQTLLTRLGYQVDVSGRFDDATADAVIDFKMKNGLHQSYKLQDGTYAVNEYVGEDTAQAMVEAIRQKSAA